MNEIKIGARIAELRNINNITQLELAEKLGVTDRAVSKWETGGGFPDITLLPQIADTFNVSIDYLLRGRPRIKQEIYANHVSNKYNDYVSKLLKEQLDNNGSTSKLLRVIVDNIDGNFPLTDENIERLLDAYRDLYKGMQNN